MFLITNKPLTKLLILLFSSSMLTHSIAAKENNTEQYPAPPGHYHTAEIPTPPSLPTTKHEAPTKNRMETQTINDPIKLETHQVDTPEVTQIKKLTQQLNKVTEKPAVSIKNTYPDALTLKKNYQQAKNLPFSQWGQTSSQTQPSQTFREGNYGSTLVPIHPSQPQSYPQILRNVRPTMPYPNMPYPNIPRSLNYIPGDHYSMGFNPGNLMNGPNRFMPPSGQHLKPFQQYPVPQNIYGTRSQSIMSNHRYRAKIPADEIIYPPSYPGQR